MLHLRRHGRWPLPSVGTCGTKLVNIVDIGYKKSNDAHRDEAVCAVAVAAGSGIFVSGYLHPTASLRAVPSATAMYRPFPSGIETSAPAGMAEA